MYCNLLQMKNSCFSITNFRILKGIQYKLCELRHANTQPFQGLFLPAMSARQEAGF